MPSTIYLPRAITFALPLVFAMSCNPFVCCAEARCGPTIVVIRKVTLKNPAIRDRRALAHTTNWYGITLPSCCESLWPECCREEQNSSVGALAIAVTAIATASRENFVEEGGCYVTLEFEGISGQTQRQVHCRLSLACLYRTRHCRAGTHSRKGTGEDRGCEAGRKISHGGSSCLVSRGSWAAKGGDKGKGCRACVGRRIQRPVSRVRNWCDAAVWKSLWN